MPNKRRKNIWKSRENILSLLSIHPEYTARKLAAEIGITEKAVEKHLAKLKAEGLIKREGPDKGGSWKVQSVVLIGRPSVVRLGKESRCFG